ncbi:hypothetical protein HY214_01420 [Candidatus Roizmanbacteria bacterium]|nr:hypothetical protein [Candidatus Roizmanbacteria bacterium]
MFIFAHRGLLHKYPENSLPALSIALKTGFCLETDLRLTRNGDFIVMHDETFTRLNKDSTPVSSLTLKECVSRTYKDSAAKFVSFLTVIQEIKKYKKRLHAIHLKSDSQTNDGLKILARYWKEYDLYHNAFVFDLTQEAAAKLKRIDKSIKIACTVSENKFAPTVYLWSEVKHNRNFDFVWAAEYRKLYSSSFIREVRKHKEKVFAVSPDVHRTLDHPLARSGFESTWKHLIDWGIDGICTDEPIKLQSYL